MSPADLAACAKAVLSIWLGWAPWSGDAGETLEQRTELIAPVAVAVCLATEDPVERGFLTVQADAETRLARHVIEHRCSDGPRGFNCDGGLSKGPWQVQEKWCRPAWDESLTDLERHVYGARCALRLWRWGLWHWGSWAGGFEAQVRQRGDVLPWASRRASRMGPVVERMRVLE